MNDEKTVTIDGKNYQFDDLPNDIKNMVQLYNKWNFEYQNSKTETMKLEIALAGLSKQIVDETAKMV